MNEKLCKEALDKIGNPNILVNLVSQRIKQLASGGGSGKPLVDNTATMSFADIALKEIAEGKVGWEPTSSPPEGVFSAYEA